MLEGQMNSNKKNGVWKQFFESGKTQVVMTYEQDKNKGDYFVYNKNGVLVDLYYYGNGEKNYNPDFVEYLDEGDKMYVNNKNKEALEFYSKAIEVNPDVAVLYFKRAMCYSLLFRFEESLTDYDKVISLNPEMKDAYALRGMTKINIMNHDIPREKQTPADRESACADFQKAVSSGEISLDTEDLIFIYCKAK